MGGIRVITGDVIFDLPFYNAKGILTGVIFMDRGTGSQSSRSSMNPRRKAARQLARISLKCVYGMQVPAMRKHQRSRLQGKHFRLMQRKGSCACMVE